MLAISAPAPDHNLVGARAALHDGNNDGGGDDGDGSSSDNDEDCAPTSAAPPESEGFASSDCESDVPDPSDAAYARALHDRARRMSSWSRVDVATVAPISRPSRTVAASTLTAAAVAGAPAAPAAAVAATAVTVNTRQPPPYAAVSRPHHLTAMDSQQSLRNLGGRFSTDRSPVIPATATPLPAIAATSGGPGGTTGIRSELGKRLRQFRSMFDVRKQSDSVDSWSISSQQSSSSSFTGRGTGSINNINRKEHSLPLRKQNSSDDVFGIGSFDANFSTLPKAAAKKPALGEGTVVVASSSVAAVPAVDITPPRPSLPLRSRFQVAAPLNTDAHQRGWLRRFTASRTGSPLNGSAQDRQDQYFALITLAPQSGF